jgi:hypothetical protein
MELEDDKTALILRLGIAVEPTASLSPAFHFETYQKRNWQRGWYYCKFNSGEIITKLLTLPLLWA